MCLSVAWSTCSLRQHPRVATPLPLREQPPKLPPVRPVVTSPVERVARIAKVGTEPIITKTSSVKIITLAGRPQVNRRSRYERQPDNSLTDGALDITCKQPHDRDLLVLGIDRWIQKFWALNDKPSLTRLIELRLPVRIERIKQYLHQTSVLLVLHLNDGSTPSD